MRWEGITPELLDRLESEFWGNVVITFGCWEWGGDRVRQGYGACWSPVFQTGGAHRIAWILSNRQAIPRKMLICHRCDNPPCVRPDHLYCGTHADNRRDWVLRGIKKPYHPPRLKIVRCKDGIRYYENGILVRVKPYPVG